MIVKRDIKTYEDFLVALQAKAFDDPVYKNEANDALGNFRQKNPELFDKYSRMCEGVEGQQPIVPAKARKPRKKIADKKQLNSEHPEINVKRLRNIARKRLMKGKFGFDLPSWITEDELLSSIDQLTISDLTTEAGDPVQRATLYRKCIILAATSGRIDEGKLRQVVFNRCRIIWNNITDHPDYSLEALKYFILEVATAEELADAGIDYNKLVDIMYDKRIKELNVR